MRPKVQIGGRTASPATQREASLARISTLGAVRVAVPSLTPDLSLAVPTPLTGFASRSTPNFVYLAGYLVASAACPKWYER